MAIYSWFMMLILPILLIIYMVIYGKIYHHHCKLPFFQWVMVDATTMSAFLLLLLVDDGLVARMGLGFGWQQRNCFRRRIVVLSILAFLLYPFLLVWTIIGNLWWFINAKKCWLTKSEIWVFLFLLAFNHCELFLIASMSIIKWWTRRKEHLLCAPQGIPISEFGVLVDMIRVPDQNSEAAGQEMREMGQQRSEMGQQRREMVEGPAAYQPGLYLTPAQREAVEALVQEHPKFKLKDVPTDCSECPVCLDEFHVGNEVRALPCAHYFHVECIDEWLQLNKKCPRCCCSVFQNLELSALSNIQADSERSNVLTQPTSQNNLLRLQGLLP
ncbi:hypothetical protein ACH5RR_025590 [Cinchona calisaya]|uniref:RING-type domain-containing protein n=1 Tax=Cinchona calisaya TaxID=153742 RepID=A0ABD2Z168_9GENT